MNLEGLTALLEKIEAGAVHCLTVASPTPSPFSHEILNANPYAFLDDAPLEERQARAVTMLHALPTEEHQSLGALDPAAIASVTNEAWPVLRDADELEDALHRLIWVPEELARDWQDFFLPLVETKRALKVTVGNPRDTQPPSEGWVTPEHLPHIRTAFSDEEVPFTVSPHENPFPQPSALDAKEAMTCIVRGWMECIGPVTEGELAQKLHFPPLAIQTALRQLEGMGEVIRGPFRPESPTRATTLPSSSHGNSSDSLAQTPKGKVQQQEMVSSPSPCPNPSSHSEGSAAGNRTGLRD